MGYYCSIVPWLLTVQASNTLLNVSQGDYPSHKVVHIVINRDFKIKNTIQIERCYSFYLSADAAIRIYVCLFPLIAMDKACMFSGTAIPE